MADFSNNPQALAAIEAIDDGENVCLIGKAGSGKTTLVHHIREKMRDKRIAVLAPTGIAAINADGQTIHSLFHFPFRTMTPAKDWAERKYVQLDDEAVGALRQLDVLIIDEISMVRADTFDAMSVVMQCVHGNDPRPFGGIQVLLVGDPYQLPPVVTNKRHEDELLSDQDLMAKAYKSPFFFDSQAYWQEPFKVIELTHIYRQEAGAFVDILNNIRDGIAKGEDLALLNSRVENHDPDRIYLTSTRKECDAINEARLKTLGGKVISYKAVKSGYFPNAKIPQDSKLIKVSVGSRIMTTFNNPEGGYVNGTIGTVTSIHKTDGIIVEVDSDYVLRSTTIHVKMNKLTEIGNDGRQVGAYSFMPVRLAWAITIHKSQGLTFSKLNLCPKSIFAAGQLYVALSRCRSLEGLILADPVYATYVKVSKRIKLFMEKVAKDRKDGGVLPESK